MTKKRIVIASTAVPPTASGQALMLGRLIKNSDSIAPLFMTDSASVDDLPVTSEYGSWVKFKPARFQLFKSFSRDGKSGQNANNFSGLLWSVAQRAAEIRRLSGPSQPDAIIGCSGNPFDLPAAYLAAQQMHVPFIAYLFDDPVFQFPAGQYRRLARFWEPLWSNVASAIITPNEVLAEDVMLRRPEARPVILRNPIDDSAFDCASDTLPPPSQTPVRIVYTGSVYHAQADAFQNLIAAMARSPGQYRLDIFTSQPQSVLNANGVTGPDVYRHEHLDGPAVFEAQRNADVLFLPLAFRSKIQDVIRSSSPGKLGEYLASGRPILVHAPKDSFVSTFFHAHGAGIIVDTDSVDLLFSGLNQVAFDEASRHIIVGRARIAAAQFNQGTARQRFDDIIENAITRVMP